MDELVEDVGHGERVVEEDEALAHAHVIGSRQLSVHVDEAAEDDVAELAVLE